MNVNVTYLLYVYTVNIYSKYLFHVCLWIAPDCVGNGSQLVLDAAIFRNACCRSWIA